MLISEVIMVFIKYCWYFYVIFRRILLINIYFSQSTAILYSFCECKFYNFPSKKAQCLTLIGYTGLRPLNLTGFKIFKFSFNLFINVSIN